MNTLFKQFQRYTFLQVILYIITGSLALLYPQQFSRWVIYLIAAYVALLGLANLMAALKERRQYNVTGLQFYLGIFLLIGALGILVLAKPLLTLTTILLGFFILVNGVMRVMQAFDLKKMNHSFLPWIIYGLILVVIGLILMFNALSSIMTLIGSVLIFMGISELIGYFQLRKLEQ